MPRYPASKAMVQVRNPRTGRYVLIDTDAGRIVAEKGTAGPYHGIRISHPQRVGEAQHDSLPKLREVLGRGD